MATVPEELQSLIERLPPDDLKRVLDYAPTLAKFATVSAYPFASRLTPDVLLGITVAPEAGEAMAQTLHDCEQIDPDE